MKANNLAKILLVVLVAGVLMGMAARNRVAEEKKKVLDILPKMTEWKEAYEKWAAAHDGIYHQGGSWEDGSPTAADLGVSWPEDWECEDDSKVTCRNKEWYCGNTEDGTGGVVCSNDYVFISMYQSDAAYTCRTGLETFEGKTICGPGEKEALGLRICASLGRMAKGCPLDFIVNE